MMIITVVLMKENMEMSTMGIFVFDFQVLETDTRDRIIPNNCSASRFTLSRDAGQQNLHAKVIEILLFFENPP